MMISSGLRTSRRLLGAALLPLLLAGCEAEAVELVQEIEAARGDCTREGLRASDEACVEMMGRYAEMGTELMHTYLGGLKAMDRALDRMPPPEFDTAGVGYALSPEFRGGDALAPGGSPGQQRSAFSPSAAYEPRAESSLGPAATGASDRIRWRQPGYPNAAGPPRGASGYRSDSWYDGDRRYDRYDPYRMRDRYLDPRYDRRGLPAQRELLRERFGPLSGDRWFYLDRYESGVAGSPYGRSGYPPFSGHLPPYGGLSRAWSYGPYQPGGGYTGYGYGIDGFGGYSGYDYGGYGDDRYGYDGYAYDGYGGAYGYGDAAAGYGGNDEAYGWAVPPRGERGRMLGSIPREDGAAADGYDRDGDRTPAEDWGYTDGGVADGGRQPDADPPAAYVAPAPARPAPHQPGILLPPEERLRRPWLED